MALFPGRNGRLSCISRFLLYICNEIQKNFTRYKFTSMKKKVFFAAAALAAFAWQPASAQLNFGVKAGLNINKMHISGGDNLNSDNRAGWFIGPTAEFKVPLIGLGVNGALLFDQRKTKFDENSTYTENFLAVPINLKYSFGLSSLAGGFLTAGPQFSCKIGGKNKTWDDYTYNSKTWATSFNVGAGVRLGGHLDIGANYNFTLGKSGSIHETQTPTENYKARNNGWQIYLGYVF